MRGTCSVPAVAARVSQTKSSRTMAMSTGLMTRPENPSEPWRLAKTGIRSVKASSPGMPTE